MMYSTARANVLPEPAEALYMVRDCAMKRLFSLFDMQRYYFLLKLFSFFLADTLIICIFATDNVKYGAL